MGTLFFVVILVAVIGLFIFRLVTKRKREQGMAAMAAQRGWTALGNDATTLMPYLPQYLQNLGEKTAVDMAYKVVADGIEIVFFQYQYTVYTTEYNATTHTEQQQSDTSTFTVVHTQLAKSYPNVLLLHHTFMSKLATITEHWGLQKLSLEGDFNEHYDSYIAPGSEIEALTLLAPDVMALLIDNLEKASLQFTGQAMIVSIETSNLSAKTIVPLLDSILPIAKKINGIVPAAPTPTPTPAVLPVAPQ